PARPRPRPGRSGRRRTGRVAVPTAWADAISWRLSWNPLALIWLLSDRVLQKFTSVSQTYSQGGARLQGDGEESRPSAHWRNQKRARQRLRSSRSRMLWQRLLRFWVVARHWLRLSLSRIE